MPEMSEATIADAPSADIVKDADGAVELLGEGPRRDRQSRVRAGARDRADAGGGPGGRPRAAGRRAGPGEDAGRSDGAGARARLGARAVHAGPDAGGHSGSEVLDESAAGGATSAS